MESKLGDADINKVHPCDDEAIKQTLMGLQQKDVIFTKKVLSKVDIAHQKGEKDVLDAYKSIIKTMHYLGFYDDPTVLETKD